MLPDINIKLIPKKINIKSISNRIYNISEYAFTFLYNLENNNRIALIEAKYTLFIVYRLT